MTEKLLEDTYADVALRNLMAQEPIEPHTPQWHMRELALRLKKACAALRTADDAYASNYYEFLASELEAMPKKD